MSFEYFERSNYDGQPITLYEFSLAETFWRYNSGSSDIELGGHKWLSVAITHRAYTLSGDPSSDELVVAISGYAEITKLFVGTPPSDPVTLSLRSLHRGDDEAPVVWSGQVKVSKRISQVEVEITANSLLATLNRSGLRLSWQRGCPHALYDRMCSVNPDHYGVRVKIEALNGDKILSTDIARLPAGYFNGGFISFIGNHSTTERRAVEAHSENTITLMGNTDGLLVHQYINVYPGCNRTTADCRDKFRNLSNYGGIPQLPNKSPFDGDPVF